MINHFDKSSRPARPHLFGHYQTAFTALLKWLIERQSAIMTSAFVINWFHLEHTTMSITRRTALLSVAAALVTMGLKFGAFLLTGSVGLLSDAAEFSVNLVAALIAFTALTIADRPPDDDHTYGHDKAEYFSSGAEGTLILIAAAVILYTAVNRILHPVPLENLGIGVVIALIASAINFGVSRIMLRVARQEDSIALEADANHLMTDVWTSVGVVVAVGLVAQLAGKFLTP